jgi:two-component system phosphate regulon sensor histidine kinase PhoR
MNNKKYQWILYLIVFVILCTIGIQIYWNYKNYQTNKQQLINDVQVSLDNAVDAYYANLAESSTLGLAINATSAKDNILEHNKLDTIFSRFEFSTKRAHNLDSLKLIKSDGVHYYTEGTYDSILKHSIEHEFDSTGFPRRLLIKDFGITGQDSLSIDNFKELTSQVIISMTQDSLNLKAIDSILKNELLRKNLEIEYDLELEVLAINKRHVKTVHQKVDSLKKGPLLSTVSKSSFLPGNTILKINFTNETKVILKRILSGILISTLLVLAVISCLFYLLKIIRYQKQLAEVKNDLISNITHEFKTPIATIGVALESIKNFNVLKDTEKTKSYLDMSGQQLKKLNVMVEKLLETATLDSDSLILHKDPTDLIDLIRKLTEKYRLGLEGKTITFNSHLEELTANIDVFHFENAVNNILDNALKYGGDQIDIIAKKENKDLISIEITDNGKTITKANKNKIFEKFYRIPTGNTHDIKGFGIGLFYSKSIIEKHDGLISVDLNKKGTTFKITIPK